MPRSLSGACPVGGFEFLYTKCQRLPPEGEEREVMEKQSMRLAGAPGIVCVACLIFLSVVPGVNQSLQADRTAPRWNHPQAKGIWTHRRLGGQWGPFSGEPWPHLPRGGSVLEQGAGKGFVSGKALRMSGDWAGKHPFKAGESRRGGTRLLGHCLPLPCVGRDRRELPGKKGILGVALLFLLSRLAFPHLLFPDTHLLYLLS